MNPHLFGYIVLCTIIVALAVVAMYFADKTGKLRWELGRIARVQRECPAPGWSTTEDSDIDDMIALGIVAQRAREDTHYAKRCRDHIAELERLAAERALAAIRLIDPVQLAPHFFDLYRQRVGGLAVGGNPIPPWSDAVANKPLVGEGWNAVAVEALDVVESAIRSYCAAPPGTAGDAGPAEVSP